jgi:Cof subfamily protein (haloacid dehalogenase superfamily)
LFSYNERIKKLLKLDFNAIKKRFKNIKLIVSDIDGTLVNNENKIGEFTTDVIKKIQKKGIHFTLATQRVHSSIVPLALQLDIKAPLISLNGALIQDVDSKNVLNKAVINKNKVIKAIELANRYFVKVGLCYNDRILYTEDNSVLKDFMTRLGATYSLVESYDKYTDNVLEIIMSGNERDSIKYILNKMRFPFGWFLKVKYYRSQSFRGVYNLEILKQGINKKVGVGIIAKNLGVKKEQVMVFGDWYNDRDLFKFGGLNIALENAVPELKAMSNYITEKSNEDEGVGEVLKQLYDSL